MKKTNETKYERAQKKVKAIKGFYSHLAFYLVFNVALLLVKGKLFNFLVEKSGDTAFGEWFDWNVLLTPILWGIGLLIHGLCVFNHKLFNGWEERKIKEYLEKEKNEVQRWS